MCTRACVEEGFIYLIERDCIVDDRHCQIDSSQVAHGNLRGSRKGMLQGYQQQRSALMDRYVVELFHVLAEPDNTHVNVVLA